jgi:hypothetical protein
MTTLPAEVVELEEVITVSSTRSTSRAKNVVTRLPGGSCPMPITTNFVSGLRNCTQLLMFSRIVTASKVVSTAKKVRHNPPMTSISKAIGTLEDRKDTLKKFQEDVVAELKYADGPEKVVRSSLQA